MTHLSDYLHRSACDRANRTIQYTRYLHFGDIKKTKTKLKINDGIGNKKNDEMHSIARNININSHLN